MPESSASENKPGPGKIFAATQNNRALHVDAAGSAGRSSEMSRRIWANRILGIAPLADIRLAL